MKLKIHPKYYTNTKVTCACGNSYTSGSTALELKVDVCGKCHPFYTGKAKFIDTEGRVEKFIKKQKFAESVRAVRAKKIMERKEKEKKTQDRPITLKDMLKEASG